MWDFGLIYTSLNYGNENDGLVREKRTKRVILLKYYKKIKKWVLVCSYTSTIVGKSAFGHPIVGQVMVPLSPPAISLQKLLNRDLNKYRDQQPQSILLIDSAKQKIVLEIFELEKTKMILLDLESGKISLDQAVESLKTIAELRGGGFTPELIGAVLIGIFVVMWVNSGGSAEAFQNQLKNFMDNYGPRKFNPFQPTSIIYPPTNQCGHGGPRSITTVRMIGESRKLTGVERRNLPHPYDLAISVDNHQSLCVRYRQAKYKTPAHGALADLNFTQINDGRTKSENNHDNVVHFMEYVRDLTYHPDNIWYEDNTYVVQDRIRNTINVYNEEKNQVIVFEKETGNFITLCQPRDDEQKTLLETGNFVVGPKIPGLAQSLPPVTLKNTFASDVMGITPVDTEIQSESLGVTPRDMFAENILQISPTDDHFNKTFPENPKN